MTRATVRFLSSPRAIFSPTGVFASCTTRVRITGFAFPPFAVGGRMVVTSISCSRKERSFSGLGRDERSEAMTSMRSLGPNAV